MTVTQIARAQSVALATAPGQRLRADAAAAWDAAVRAFGSTVLLTDSLRPYDVQERIFRDRYRQGNHRGKAGFTTDVRMWNGRPWTRRAGTAAAAVPGTSNHGGGVAVDVKTRRSAGDPSRPAAVVFASFTDADRLRFLDVARPYGWADDEGRRVGEHWHLTYYPDRDQHQTTGGFDVASLPTIKHGAKGDTVRAAQILLNGRGYPVGTPDGAAGDRWVTGCMAFQKAHKLTPDGECGPKTWPKLLGA